MQSALKHAGVLWNQSLLSTDRPQRKGIGCFIIVQQAPLFPASSLSSLSSVFPSFITVQQVRIPCFIIVGFVFPQGTLISGEAAL
jgi:hypothetical protein